MKKENLFEKITILKDKFKSFFQHRKKITALENFSSAEKFPHKNYLGLVKECMNDGFLGEEESDFLDHMLSKYEVNYLDWAHKTKWLKSQIKTKAEKRVVRDSQVFFDFEKKSAGPYIPVEILNSFKNSVERRA